MSGSKKLKAEWMKDQVFTLASPAPWDLGELKQAVDVTDPVPPTVPYGQVGETVSIQGGTCRPLASCDKFTAELVTVAGTVSFGRPDTFTSLLVLEGEGTLAWQGLTLPLKKGDSVFLPAGLEAALSGAAPLLVSRV